MRVNLGAGKTEKKPGDIFVDLRPFEGIDIVHDLNLTPWPFESGTVSEINAIHVVEHLESLLTFMDECHRVLMPVRITVHRNTGSWERHRPHSCRPYPCKMLP